MCGLLLFFKETELLHTIGYASILFYNLKSTGTMISVLNNRFVLLYLVIIYENWINYSKDILCNN